MNKFNKTKSLEKKELKIFKNAKFWFIVPLAIIFVALICGIVYGTDGNKYDGFANIGIDFKGGTVLTVDMTGAEMLGNNYKKNVKIIKDIVLANGAEVATEQSSGNNTIILRYPNSILVDGKKSDFNVPEKTEDMIKINTNIENEVVKALKSEYTTPEVKITASAEMINSTASSDLIKKALISVGVAMLLMLIYTAIRFDFFSGLSAFVTQINDIIVLLSLVIIFRIQINSTLIAAIITIVGYSINNTLLVFDRVRNKVKQDKIQGVRINPGIIVDQSVGQSVSRALITTGTTLTTILLLSFVGIKSLTEFALPIIFGIISGLYSSIFLAPSLWGLMMNLKIHKDSGDSFTKKSSKQNRLNKRTKARV